MGRILDLFINKYNYTDFHELNLDWIISDLRTLAETLENFINLNTIKYANPIQWNISTQFEANTVVVDPNTGTAYLSVKPVPSGVALSNTDYWTAIFTLNFLSANQNITLRDDGQNILSTFSSAVDDWLIWQDILYKVTQAINVNEAYVPGYNITRYTVELFINDLKTSLLNMIGQLSDLNTTDKTNLVAAINEVLTTLNNTSGDLSDLNTTDKTNLVAAINEINAKENEIRPEQFGAVADGVTDDLQAITDAIAYADGRPVLFTDGKTYGVSGINIDFGITENAYLYSNGTAKILSLTSAYHPDESLNQRLNNVFTFNSVNNITFKNIIFDGNETYTERPLTESGDEWTAWTAKRSKSLDNMTFEDSSNINVINCEFMGGLQGLRFINSTDIIVDKCSLHDYMADSMYFIDGCKRAVITNCHSYNNGDDCYCINSHGGSDKPYNENITFINCTGEDISGNLCFANNSKTCSFIDCSGSVRRSAGLSCSQTTYSTYGKIADVLFQNCRVNVKNAIATNIVSGSAADKNLVHNIIFDGCEWYSDNINVQLGVLRVAGVKLKNCKIDGIAIILYESNKCLIDGCYLNLAKNFSTINCVDVKITNNIIINNGLRLDTAHGDVATDSTNVCAINLYNIDCEVTGNTFIDATTGGLAYHDIIIDGYNAAGHTMTLECDSILDPNTSASDIILIKPINLTNSTFGAIANQLADGSLYIDTSNVLHTIINNTAKAFTLT